MKCDCGDPNCVMNRMGDGILGMDLGGMLEDMLGIGTPESIAVEMEGDQKFVLLYSEDANVRKYFRAKSGLAELDKEIESLSKFVTEIEELLETGEVPEGLIDLDMAGGLLHKVGSMREGIIQHEVDFLVSAIEMAEGDEKEKYEHELQIVRSFAELNDKDISAWIIGVLKGNADQDNPLLSAMSAMVRPALKLFMRITEHKVIGLKSERLGRVNELKLFEEIVPEEMHDLDKEPVIRVPYADVCEFLRMNDQAAAEPVASS